MCGDPPVGGGPAVPTGNGPDGAVVAEAGGRDAVDHGAYGNLGLVQERL